MGTTFRRWPVAGFETVFFLFPLIAGGLRRCCSGIAVQKNAANPENRTGGKNLFGVLILFLCLVFCCSCSNDGRLVKKFVKRINAKEVNAASKYIYPADPRMSVFFQRGSFKKNSKPVFKNS
jgi:hypothetical protein